MASQLHDRSRDEALYLILGFCQDHGLSQTARMLMMESQLGLQPREELAQHVSLLRILLDWKRAFEARFHGTPRIIQPVASTGGNNATMCGLDNMPDGNMHNPSANEIMRGSQAGNGTYPLPSLGGAGPNNQDSGSLPTLQYVSNNNPSINQQHQMFRQPQAMGSNQQHQNHYVMGSQMTSLGGAADSTEHMNGHGLRPPITNHMPRNNTLDSTGMPLGLPPRPPAGSTMTTPGVSMYNAHDHGEPDCSRDTSHDWQMPGDVDEAGLTRGSPLWSMHGGSMGGQMPAAVPRRMSTAGSNIPITKMKNGTEPITQDTFLKVINTVGEGAVASQLFEFRRPQRGAGSSARRSAILQLDDAQHDAMYALAGCEDVNFLISNVAGDVRVAMHKVFGIDKESFTVWFKNRGRNPSKQNYANNHGNMRNGMPKRARTSENNTSSPE